jgi:hypothetical protein
MGRGTREKGSRSEYKKLATLFCTTSTHKKGNQDLFGKVNSTQARNEARIRLQLCSAAFDSVSFHFLVSFLRGTQTFTFTNSTIERNHTIEITSGYFWRREASFILTKRHNVPSGPDFDPFFFSHERI